MAAMKIVQVLKGSQFWVTRVYPLYKNIWVFSKPCPKNAGSLTLSQKHLWPLKSALLCAWYSTDCWG